VIGDVCLHIGDSIPYAKAGLQAGKQHAQRFIVFDEIKIVRAPNPSDDFLKGDNIRHGANLPEIGADPVVPVYPVS
jgi:hypothetical protein